MIKRQLKRKLIDLAKSYPVLALTGPRQSGKTTLVKEVFSETHKYVNLENLDMKEFAKSDPRAFLEEYGEGTIIDEAQNAPDLFSYIQTYVDERKKAAQFILTGSQNFLLHAQISQSLAGRVAILNLLPLSISEIMDHNFIVVSLEDLLFSGFYPRVVCNKLDPTTWYANYFKTYIERDVRSMQNIQDLGTFQTFIKMCAARAGQLLDLTSLGNDCGISHTTARGWINILEASFILFRLQPHYKNFNKRLVKSPKLFFYDTGLLCYLLNIDSAKLLNTHYLRGGIFESFVISELIKNRLNANKDPSIYFWRDHQGHEIDCIIEEGEKLVPIEIKSSKTINSSFFSSLNYWSELAKECSKKGFLVYAGEQGQNRSQAEVLSWKKISDIALNS